MELQSGRLMALAAAAGLKARRTAAGLVSLKNVWAHPDDVLEMRDHAAKLARRREKLAKQQAG